MSDETGGGETDKRTNLGRGLAALFGEEEQDYAALDKLRSAKTVPVERLHANRLQPRQSFDEESLKTLADSIVENGILQPLLVRRHAEKTGEFEIVAGERRWRAAQMARLHEIPVVIRELSDHQALEAAIVENVQRLDLSPIEEAAGYQRLMSEFQHTQDALARIIGKSRSHIANTLRLLSLPDAVKAMVTSGELSAGHARPLIGLDNAESLARRIAAEGLNVRQAERLVQESRGAAPAKGKAAKVRTRAEKDPDTLALERDLSALLGLKVSIDFRGKGGSLTVHYKTLEQLDDVLQRLSHGPPEEAD